MGASALLVQDQLAEGDDIVGGALGQAFVDLVVGGGEAAVRGHQQGDVGITVGGPGLALRRKAIAQHDLP